MEVHTISQEFIAHKINSLYDVSYEGKNIIMIRNKDEIIPNENQLDQQSDYSNSDKEEQLDRQSDDSNSDNMIILRDTSQNSDISFRKKKKAVFISGIARFYKETFIYTKNNFYKYNSDFFICFWNINGEWKLNKKNYGLSYDKDCLDKNSVDINTIFNIIEICKPLCISLLSYEECNKHFSDKYNNITSLDKRTCDHGENYLKMLINQHYLLECNFTTFSKNFESIKLDYDYFIRTRLDSVIKPFRIDLTKKK